MSASALRIQGRVVQGNIRCTLGWRWNPDVLCAPLATCALVEPTSRSVLLGRTLPALDYVSKPSARFVSLASTVRVVLLKQHAPWVHIQLLPRLLQLETVLPAQ